MLILGVPAERIRAFGRAWSDGGLWDDISWLADRVWIAPDDDERRTRWHHFVMAIGNFKRQNGRRLRPARIAPAHATAHAARHDRFRVLAGPEVICDDAGSWTLLEQCLGGAAAATTTTILAALWPGRLRAATLAGIALRRLSADHLLALHRLSPGELRSGVFGEPLMKDAVNLLLDRTVFRSHLLQLSEEFQILRDFSFFVTANPFTDCVLKVKKVWKLGIFELQHREGSSHRSMYSCGEGQDGGRYTIHLGYFEEVRDLFAHDIFAAHGPAKRRFADNEAEIWVISPLQHELPLLPDL